MRRIVLAVGPVLFLAFAVIGAGAQATNPNGGETSQSPPTPSGPPPSPRVQNPRVPNEPKAPDMVCFGYYPNWSVQFVNGEARYLADNEPDQYFLGDFYWVPDENTWDWHRANGLAPINGGYGLSASIDKTACHDDVLKETFPYSAEVNLPQGDIVSGCCRKLKPGEAPVGKHGVPPQALKQAPAPEQPSAQ